MASKMSLFWPNDDYITYASNYLYVLGHKESMTVIFEIYNIVAVYQKLQTRIQYDEYFSKVMIMS